MGLVRAVPLFLASPRILLWDLRADRRNPPLAALAAESDAERFVWRILPHAARSFALSIMCLSRPAARACAVGYLQCRILDTLEDLVADPVERRAALLAAAQRLPRGAAPIAVRSWVQQDARDALHRLLLQQAHKVDAVTRSLPQAEQHLVHQLVHDMAMGMLRCDALRSSGGALRDDAALVDYCDTVIGGPLRFCAQLFLRERRDGAERVAAAAPHMAGASAFLQLANISRDLEKDLARCVVHVPELEPWLPAALVSAQGGAGHLMVAPTVEGAALRAAVAAARRRITHLALAHRAAFEAAVAAVAPGRCSPVRLAAWVLRRSTLRHHQRMLRRAASD